MLTETAQTSDRIDHLPTELDSAQSKLVYLTLERPAARRSRT